MQIMEQQNKTNFMCIQQIADTLGLSKHSIYKLCQAGELAHYKVGGSIRVKVEDFVTDQKSSADLERLVSARRSAVDPGVSFQECAKQNPSCSLSCSPGMP
jgi:excisionase family DNA binding protein